MSDNRWIIEVNHHASEGIWRRWTIGNQTPKSIEAHMEFLKNIPLAALGRDEFSLRFVNSVTKEIIPFEVFGW